MQALYLKKGVVVKISLIENGIDSLKKGFESLKKYEEMHFIDRRGEERFYTLKDAILSINHGVEILFKQVLINHNELLVFSDFDKALKSAFKEKRQKKLTSIFETEKSPHTVTMQEAIDRLSSFCGIEIDKKMLLKINQLEKYRNQITHSAIFIKEEDVSDTFNGLIDKVDTFFLQELKDSYSSVSGYTEFKEKYQEYLDKSDETQQDVKRESIEKLIEAFSKCSLSMGQNEARIVDDINVAMQVMAILKSSSLTFGADFYNNHNTGEIGEIKRISSDVISIFTEDNQTDYRFKFKSLMIYLPEVESDFSPILFFEADDSTVDTEFGSFVKDDFSGKKVLSGIHLVDEARIEYDREKINKFFHDMDDDLIPYRSFWSIEYYLTKGIFCFINVQGLNYGRMGRILDGSHSLKEIQVILNRGK
ncbi:hypothetical protein [Aliivibrio sp. 1S128]|uniref:hypothetical protein n=1 Tax=Aliivibrio sp. 1S128 TaxID=1840085 RepID=UPI00080E9D04|nr:hypothetical protein [Aliivibrio sp. 1S128]OCH20388.1 hypothetical protein A6E03_19505 [Aliivibrio sp. 1S128]